MSGPSGLIEKKETEEDLEDKPNEKNPITLLPIGEVIPDSKLQTDTIHTNRHQPLYVAPGRSVMIDVKIVDQLPFGYIVIQFDGISSCPFYQNYSALILMDDPPFEVGIEMKERDFLRVTIYDVMGYFGKEIIFYHNGQPSIPFKIYELTKDNDPDYLGTNIHVEGLLTCERFCPWFFRKVKPMKERNQVFLFDDKRSLKAGGENKPHDENKPEEEKTETSESGPKIIRVTTVPKGPGPKRL